MMVLFTSLMVYFQVTNLATWVYFVLFNVIMVSNLVFICYEVLQIRI